MNATFLFFGLLLMALSLTVAGYGLKIPTLLVGAAVGWAFWGIYCYTRSTVVGDLYFWTFFFALFFAIGCFFGASSVYDSNKKQTIVIKNNQQKTEVISDNGTGEDEGVEDKDWEPSPRRRGETKPNKNRNAHFGRTGEIR